MEQNVRVESLTTVEACREHERLQKLVWGQDIAEASADLLVAMTRNGGVVLGAYVEETMVGILFGLPALREGRLIHLSHLLGIHPEWRGRGIGEALKWRQREIVLSQGIDLVTWTYDPLETPNALLNLSRLGANVNRYVRDYYGAMDDALNQGLPSDRFIVNWRLNSARVQTRLHARTAVPEQDHETAIALASRSEPDSVPRPGTFMPPRDGERQPMLVEIPIGMQRIKRDAPDIALEWRLAVREACETLFDRGYAAINVVGRDDRLFYYLERTTDED